MRYLPPLAFLLAVAPSLQAAEQNEIPAFQNPQMVHAVVENNRAGEYMSICPTLCELGDGSLLMAYHRTTFVDFHGGYDTWTRVSRDGGKTWSDARLFAKQMQAAGVTRLRSGDLLLNGCTMLTERSTTMKLFRSRDNGKTWTEPKPIWEKSDGIRLQGSLGALVELQSGRILCPIHGGSGGNAGPFDAWCYYSDDGGKSWAEFSQKVKLPKRGAMEPSVAQLKDGTLVMALRTQFGSVYISQSTDDGETWSKAWSSGVEAPEECAVLAAFPDGRRLLLVHCAGKFNPKHHHFGERTPLSVAVSSDGGKTWRKAGDIVGGPHEIGATSICFTSRGKVIIGYCWVKKAWDRRRGSPGGTRVAIVGKDWLERDTTSRGSTLRPTARPGPPQRVFDVCELYALAHFGNSYEVMGQNEMRAILKEAAYWGFNRYGDWFDSDNCKDPFDLNHTYDLGNAMWDYKKVHFASAQARGLSLDLIVTPNHVYLEQCTPGLLATKETGGKGQMIMGQLICPSKPKARAIILKNCENLFADLARARVSLNHLNSYPYDYGGCRCKDCDPWILTWAKLTHEIYTIARKYHPQIKMDIIGWWWGDEEHRLFKDWVDQHAPGWVGRMYLYLPYGATRVAKVPLPKGCQRGAFPHMGYAEESSPRDMYGHLGPVIAAERLQQTVVDLKAQGVTGIMGYSEGVFDDVNKAILAGLASGQYQTSDEVLQAYARRYFGVDADTARLWAAWLKAWGKPFDVDTEQSGKTLEALLKKTPKRGWRLRQWELKQKLFAIHREIGPGTEWTPERLAAADRFWAVVEQLEREVWGIAHLRHTLGRSYTRVPWHASWAKIKGVQAREQAQEQ